MKLSERGLPPGLERHLRRLERQYRRRLRMRGLLRLGGLVLGLVLVGWWAIGWVPQGGWRGTVLCAGLAVVAVGTWQWLLRPGQVRLDRRRLALLLDERLPHLENLALSSFDFSRSDFSADSAWIVERLLQGAEADFSAAPAPGPASDAVGRRLMWATAAVWGAVVCLLLWGLAQVDWGRLGPLSYEVRPGATRLRAGENMLVWVEGAGEDRSAALRWRGVGMAWQSAALRPGDGGVYYYELENIRGPLRYQVQVGEETSPEYAVEVWTPARVERVELRYDYPDYLGLPADTLRDGGPISGPEGSRVEIEVELNKEVQAAVLEFAEGGTLALEPLGGRRWAGSFPLARDDEYSVSLRDSAGAAAEGRTYAIRVRPDRAPAVRVRLPRADDEAHALEEITFIFALEDDHGLAEYGLQYEIAGRRSVRLRLSPDSLGVTPVLTAMGRHILALEELDLRPGDLVTWSLWARDLRPGRLDYETLGDPYFLEIRPFRRLYGEAVSNSGTEAAGQGQPAADQKQVIVATWNLRREAAGLDTLEFGRRRLALVEAQRQVGVSFEPPPGRQAAAAAFAQAVAGALEALQAAALPEPGPALARALEQEQRAYAQLLRMQPRRREVGQRGEGGGGGESVAQQRELDQLETARRRDFAEEATTLAQRLQETEKLRGGLKDLARRQQAINQDLAHLVSEDAAREERWTEERRLQRLRRQQRRALAELDSLNADLQEGRLETADRQGAQQRLAEARRQMRRSAEALEGRGGQTAAAAGRRAAAALRDAGADLGRLSRAAAAERASQLRRDFEALRQRQRQLSVENRERQGGPRALQATTADSAGQRWAEAFAGFMDQAGALAVAAEDTQEGLARRLGDWLRRTSGVGIHRDMLRGDEYRRLGAWDEAAAAERRVEVRLDTAAAGLDSVLALALGNETDGVRRSFEQVSRLLADARAGRTAGGTVGGGEGEGRGELAGRWIEGVRTAEELLPRDEPVRESLRAIRGGLENALRRDTPPPRYELLFERASGALEIVAAELARRLEKGTPTAPTWSIDRVPERYRAFVAEYFKALAEAESPGR